MSAITTETASHFYWPDGRPCYEVEMKTRPGEMRPANITDARKLGLFQSVTTILGLLDKPFLTTWKIEQAIMAALANHSRMPDESPEDHIRRIGRAAGEVVDDARIRGSLIHDAIEKFVLFGEKTPDPLIGPLVEPYYAWHGQNVEEVIYAEKTVVHPTLGYAGKLDVKLRLVGRGICIADFKSRKQDSTTGRYRVYDENAMQLAAYRDADAVHNPRADQCLSIIVNSQTPDLHIHTWPAEDVERFGSVFLCLLQAYKLLKKHNPV
jgi:hypothetical protein